MATDNIKTTKIELLDDIKLKLTNNPHDREHLLFLKYFGENDNHSYTLHELDKKCIQIMDTFLNNYYKLDCIYTSTFVGYDAYKTENNEPIDSDSDITYRFDNSSRVLIDYNKDIIINFGYEYIKILSINPISNDLKESLQKIQFDSFSEKTLNCVHVLAYSQDRGMHLTDFKIDDKYLELDIESNYNDDFLPIYTNIIDNLNKNQIGLYLLHGSHGTGKTTLLRHIIRKINKRVIFISPSMAMQFSNPDMIPFLMMYPDSIIIIEDSENIIKKREQGNDQSVSNLLNISDGILGDCLKFQIICTFNTDKSDIDDALLRKGRLIESYEFGELSVEKTNKLLEKLKIPISNKAMKLADIYNPSENHFVDNKKPMIGFRK